METTTLMDTSLPGAPAETAGPYVSPGAPPIMATPPGAPVTASAETAPVEAAHPYVPPGAPPIMANQVTLFPHNPIPLFKEPPEDKMLIDPDDILKDGMDEDSSPPSAAAPAAASFAAPAADPFATPDAPSDMDTRLGGNRDRNLIINKKKNKTKKGRRKKHKTKKHKRKKDKTKKCKTKKNKIKKRKTRRNKNKNN